MVQVGVTDARPVGLYAEKLAPCHEQASIAQPIDSPATAPTAGTDDLAVPFHVDRDDLVGPPARKPQAALVPAGRLPHAEAVQQDPRVRDRSVRHASPPCADSVLDRGIPEITAVLHS